MTADETPQGMDTAVEEPMAASDFRDFKMRVDRWMESTDAVACECDQGSIIYDFATGAHLLLAEYEKQQTLVFELRTVLRLTRQALDSFDPLMERLDKALGINS